MGNSRVELHYFDQIENLLASSSYSGSLVSILVSVVLFYEFGAGSGCDGRFRVSLSGERFLQVSFSPFLRVPVLLL
jgi:hypothetical protein